MNKNIKIVLGVLLIVFVLLGILVTIFLIERENNMWLQSEGIYFGESPEVLYAWDSDGDMIQARDLCFTKEGDTYWCKDKSLLFNESIIYKDSDGKIIKKKIINEEELGE